MSVQVIEFRFGTTRRLTVPSRTGHTCIPGAGRASGISADRDSAVPAPAMWRRSILSCRTAHRPELPGTAGLSGRGARQSDDLRLLQGERRGRPLRGRSRSPANRPVAKRCRHLRTQVWWRPNCRAMASFAQPAAARRMARARMATRYSVVPARRRCSSACRSSAVSTMGTVGGGPGQCCGGCCIGWFDRHSEN